MNVQAQEITAQQTLNFWNGPSVCLCWVNNWKVQQPCFVHSLLYFFSVEDIYEFNQEGRKCKLSHKHTGRYYCKTKFPAPKCSCWIQNTTRYRYICGHSGNFPSFRNTKLCIRTMTGNKCKIGTNNRLPMRSVPCFLSNNWPVKNTWPDLQFYTVNGWVNETCVGGCRNET